MLNNSADEYLLEEYQEPSEESLLNELKLHGAGTDDLAIDEKAAEAFRMLRVPVDISDYNVDCVELTPEDENNPELLAELAAYRSGEIDGDAEETDKADEKNQRSESESELKTESFAQREAAEAFFPSEAAASQKDATLSLEKMLQERNPAVLQMHIGEAKVRAVMCKRSGDAAGSIGAFREYKALQNHLKSLTPPVNDAANGQKAANEKQLRSIIASLQEQSKACQQAIQCYLKDGQEEKAIEFLGMQKAFDKSIVDLRAELLGGCIVPATRQVKTAMPLNIEASDVPEGEMRVILAKLASNSKSPKSSKNIFNSPDGVFFQVHLEWPPDAPSLKTGSVFPLNRAESVCERLCLLGIKRDIRTAKHFEYHKLKVMLCKQETFLFRKKTAILGTGLMKLSGLLSQSHVSEAVELYDENRRPLNAAVSITLRISKPLSAKVPKSKVVQWIFIDGLPRNTSPAAGFKPKSEELSKAQQKVEGIKSFMVVEHELEKLAKIPHANLEPALLAQQLALESLRDQLAMKVDLGQLTMAEYLSTVRQAIKDKKHEALKRKREGKLDRAKECLIHIHIMEQEVSEAEAAEQE